MPKPMMLCRSSPQLFGGFDPMAEQLIAVAVTNDGTIAAHAGRALQWQVYAVSDEAAPCLAWTSPLKVILTVFNIFSARLFIGF